MTGWVMVFLGFTIGFIVFAITYNVGLRVGYNRGRELGRTLHGNATVFSMAWHAEDAIENEDGTLTWRARDSRDT